MAVVEVTVDPVFLGAVGEGLDLGSADGRVVILVLQLELDVAFLLACRTEWYVY